MTEFLLNGLLDSKFKNHILWKLKKNAKSNFYLLLSVRFSCKSWWNSAECNRANGAIIVALFITLYFCKKRHTTTPLFVPAINWKINVWKAFMFCHVFVLPKIRKEQTEHSWICILLVHQHRTTHWCLTPIFKLIIS